MARTLASGDYLSDGSVAAPAQDSTFFIRLKPSWSSGDSLGHMFFMYYTDANNIVFFQTASDNNIYAGVIVVAGGSASHYVAFSDAGLFTSGAWANWRMEVEGSAGEVRVYKNGTLVGSGNATPGAFGAITGTPKLTVGADSIAERWAAADEAEFAEWDHILSGGNSTTLESTGNPECVPSGLVRHYKILGDDSPEPDEIGSDDLTLNGTCPQATHPTVDECSGSQTVTLPLLAAAGAFYQPTITPGAVTVTLPILEAAGAFYSPTVTRVVPPGIRVTVSDSLAQG